MKIFGIVGWKNSGKTFFAQKLIQYFVNLNYSVASIKHAHHDFDIDKPGTDSFLHRTAGATQVVISSSNRWAKIEELKNSKEKKLGELLKELHSCDIVVVEGFKKENHPKIEIINKHSTPSTFLFKSIKNVIGIVSDNKLDTSIQQFPHSDIEGLANHILEKI